MEQPLKLSLTADVGLDLCELTNMPTSPDSVCFDLTNLDAQDFPLAFSFDVSSLVDFDSTKAFDTCNLLEPQLSHLNTVKLEGRDELAKLERKEKRTKKRKPSASSLDSEISEALEGSSKKAKSSSTLRSRNPTSSYRGVSRCTKDGRWQARIRVCKEVVYLGRFQSEEQAARRYDEAARLHHGRAAMLNFVTEDDVAIGCKSVFSCVQGATQEISQC